MSEELLLDKSLKKIVFLFRLTGLNFDKKKRSFMQNFIFLFNFLWHQTDVLTTVAWIINGIRKGKSFTEVTFVVPCTIFGILVDIKSICLLVEESNALRLMDTLRNLEIKSKALVKFERDRLIKPEINMLNSIINVLKVLSFLMLIVFNFFPPILIAVKYFTTGQLKLILPFLDVYPFDSNNLRIWPFAYAHQFWSVCISLLEMCAIDYFFFTCCSHIRIQFKLLQHQFREVVTNRTVNAVDSTDQLTDLAKFKELVKWHQEIISSADILEQVYSVSTLFNFLASSLIICLTGFNVTTVDDKAVVMCFLTFLFMSIMQVFFLCFFGDILMSTSTDVAEDVYKSKWYTSNLVIQKNILKVQTRAQIPCTLTAFGFANVNLEAYMKILSTSWSYFALLQTVYSARS